MRKFEFVHLLSWTETCSVRVNILLQDSRGEDEQVIV